MFLSAKQVERLLEDKALMFAIFVSLQVLVKPRALNYLLSVNFQRCSHTI